MKLIVFFAEFFGTFLLLSAIFISGNPFVVGLTLAFNIWLLGSTSGSHVNPAVSLAFLLKGDINMNQFLMNSLSQFLGAATALYAYKALY